MRTELRYKNNQQNRASNSLFPLRYVQSESLSYKARKYLIHILGVTLSQISSTQRHQPWPDPHLAISFNAHDKTVIRDSGVTGCHLEEHTAFPLEFIFLPNIAPFLGLSCPAFLPELHARFLFSSGLPHCSCLLSSISPSSGDSLYSALPALTLETPKVIFSQSSVLP